MENEFTCCICGKTFKGWGNNPYPIVEDEKARCCDDCNINEVLVARMLEVYYGGRLNKKKKEA